MALVPSYNLPKKKKKTKIKPRSTYPKTLNLEARLRNGKVLSTHSAQIKSGLLDSHDQCTPLRMLWMICCTHKKTKSHKAIYECILFFVKNSDMCCDKKKMIFWLEKSDKFFEYVKKNQIFFITKKFRFVEK